MDNIERIYIKNNDADFLEKKPLVEALIRNAKSIIVVDAGCMFSGVSSVIIDNRVVIIGEGQSGTLLVRLVKSIKGETNNQAGVSGMGDGVDLSIYLY